MKQLTKYQIKYNGKSTTISLDSYLVTVFEVKLGSKQILPLVNKLYAKNFDKVTKSFSMSRLITIDLISILAREANYSLEQIEAIYNYKLNKGKSKVANETIN